MTFLLPIFYQIGETLLKYRRTKQTVNKNPAQLDLTIAE